jgi:hypothetical protein
MLTEPIIRECCNQNPRQLSDEGPCLMGADIGKAQHHFLIGKRIGEKRIAVLDYGSGDFNLLSDKIRRFNVKVACFDMMAEMHAVRAFQDAHPAVWGVIYSEAQRNAYNWQHEERKVTVNRSELLDHSHRAVIQKDVEFPRPGQDWKDLVKQLTNLARTVVRDPDTGTPKVRWVIRGRKNDHWRHALAYLALASETAPYSAEYRRATRRIGERTSGLTWMSG